MRPAFGGDSVVRPVGVFVEAILDDMLHVGAAVAIAVVAVALAGEPPGVGIGAVLPDNLNRAQFGCLAGTAAAEAIVEPVDVVVRPALGFAGLDGALPQLADHLDRGHLARL